MAEDETNNLQLVWLNYTVFIQKSMQSMHVKTKKGFALHNGLGSSEKSEKNQTFLLRLGLLSSCLYG